MKTLAIRLLPGQDLRRAIEDAVVNAGCDAAFVLSGIGSLSEARIRLAGAEQPEHLTGDMELVTLAGSIAVNGSHLHATLATAQGNVVGGHVAFGCIVRTTAEILLALLPEWSLTRSFDAATGYDELVASEKGER
jgi:predicted DNA-binding protein with PD1-like motif